MTSSQTHHTGRVADRAAVDEFLQAQHRLLERFGVRAESRFLDVPAIGGRAHVLVTGDGPPLIMVIGGLIPAAFWAPLMPQLPGHTLYAVDLPGFGLTDPVDYPKQPLRPLVVEFLAQLLDGIGCRRAPFVTQSQGSLWSTWLSLDRPGSVVAQVMAGCPAHVLGTTAPAPMRLMSIPGIGRTMLRLQPPSAQQADRVFAAVHEDVSGLGEIRDVLVACERLPAYADSFLGLMRAVMRLGRVRTEISLTGPQLRQVDHPVQLIWGENDPFGSSEVAHRAATFLPDAELHLVPSGHAPWFHHAELVGQLVTRFLGEHGGPGSP
ncbi:alpha/beta fold hydrolase [Gordonia rhizosphera]|uniref:AB hydrolase-1 domain-containing protein n=1 Tax=Gordonia rhizosphera NBRC 16068 TaxID=1108045 RepID=K6VPA5_9ACTN|nr:alpha/beta hydrolase [Gordonia rhizosphera]GAB88735.1 hypothetical protein GORHZ_038_00050 [Gordonia rhizosphera NBRC 16068]